MRITVSLKNVYGQVLVYPICAQAKLFASLIGAKTFNPRHLELIEKLGFTVEQEEAYKLQTNKL